MPEQLEIQSGFVSEQGKRESNQDFLAFFPGTPVERALQGSVAVIADGMGGTLGGRHAAEVTVRGFIEAYYGMSATLGVDRVANRALASINYWVNTQARMDTQLKNMGTTFSALILRGRQAHVVHLGDTRIYLLRDNRLQCLTKDHIHPHPDMQHVLTRAVGLEEMVAADYLVHNLNHYDRFLLCCDGVHGVLSDKRLQELLCKNNSAHDDARTIVQAALKSGSQDNVSALVIDVNCLPAPDQSHLELVTDSLPIKSMPKVGDRIDGFLLREKLAEGRYTCLFVAQDEVEDNGSVVLKFPKPDTASELVYHQAFLREKWIASRVQSPWVTEQIDLKAERQTRLYNVMPYYRGETLEQCLLREPMDLGKGVRIALRICKAVYALHKHRIIHRDIKPDNIILLGDDGLKLLDLGVALLPGIKDALEDTAPGTPSYMAPELFQGEQGNEQTDLYALSVTLYRMFSNGRYPYGEIEPFTRPRFDKLTPLNQYRPDLPSWLNAIMTRATDSKNHYYGDAMELAFELENGLIRGTMATQNQGPLIERNPELFWQIVSLLLVVMLLMSLVL